MAAKKKRTRKTFSNHPIDQYVGHRCRIRRLELNMSQQEFGRLIGITFQQIQKNERGINRFSASRLHEASRVLDVPVGYFFEGYKGPMLTTPAQVKDAGKKLLSPEAIEETQETTELVRVYYELGSPALRKQMVNTMRALAKTDPNSPIHSRPQRGRPKGT